MADSAEPKSTSPRGQTDVKSQGGKAPGSGKKKDKKEKKASKENQSQIEAQKKQGAGKGAENKSDQGQNDPNKPQKTKAELKAERRMLQEKQRAEKQVKASGGGVKEGGASVLKKEVKRVPDNIRADDAQTSKRIAKKLEKQQIPPRTTAQRKVQLFSHLHQYEREVSLTKPLSFSSTGPIHPMIIKLGLQYAEGVISGSNARCLAMLAVFKKVITDYKTPPQKELSRDLEVKIKPYISFLNQCRMQSIGMGNAIKYIKWHISHVPSDKNDTEAKEILLEAIDNFIRERILLAADAISKYVKEEKKIKDGDVIVVFSCSSIVRRVLCDAHKEKINFRVIVVDARPKMEGKEMLRRLVRAGIKCSYVLINAASYAMQEATKVFLGAHALLANGCVMSRVGTSLITLIAKSCNVPVLVCCETYKFCERGQTDSFVYNELGDPDDLVSIGNRTPYLNDWRDYSSLTLLNLIYDVTPPEFVSLVITELGLIPCTSVPVVLRMKQAETNET